MIVEKTVYVAAKDQDDPLLKAIIKSQTDVSQELDEARAYARVLQRKIDGAAAPDEEVKTLRRQIEHLHARIRLARDELS